MKFIQGMSTLYGATYETAAVDPEVGTDVADAPTIPLHRRFRSLIALALLSYFASFGIVSHFIPVSSPAALSRALEEVDQDLVVTDDGSTCITAAALGGAVVGAVALPVTLLVIGLTPIGPAAGSAFAGAMGPAVTAGSSLVHHRRYLSPRVLEIRRGRHCPATRAGDAFPKI